MLRLPHLKLSMTDTSLNSSPLTAHVSRQNPSQPALSPTCNTGALAVLRLDQGVEVALHRAKVWSQYAKDVLSYVEKRTCLEMEYAKNTARLAQTMRSALKEDVSSTPVGGAWTGVNSYVLGLGGDGLGLHARNLERHWRLGNRDPRDSDP